MSIDIIETLVNEAHLIFNATSVFEVTDIDTNAAVEFLNKTYNYPEPNAIEKYLRVTSLLVKITG